MSSVTLEQLGIEVTQQDLQEILTSPIGRFQKQRVACKRCHYAPGHTLVYCSKCGGEFIPIGEWTVLNVFRNVVKNHHSSEHAWLGAFVTMYLESKTGHSFTAIYREVISQYPKLTALYYETTKEP